jgi:CheY-like chemotaxis protein
MSSVLVIEDEKGILGLIEAALLRHGHRVETAEDGREGIQKFETGCFDLVITDVLMPEVDGLGVLRHIRSTARRRTPVIGMSGTPWFLSTNDFDRVLAKPFSLQKLVECVKGVAETGRAHPPAAAPSPAFADNRTAMSTC